MIEFRDSDDNKDQEEENEDNFVLIEDYVSIRT